MIRDLQNQFSDSQALTATAISTNVIDLGSAGRNIADGEPLGILVTVDVAADFTTGNETYEIDIVTDDNASMSSVTTVDTHVVLASALTLNAALFFPLPVGVNLERYIALKYILGGTTPTVTLTAELQPQSMVDKIKSYPAGYSIS